MPDEFTARSTAGARAHAAAATPEAQRQSAASQNDLDRRHAQEQRRQHLLLRTIAIFKLLKASLLVLLIMGVTHLLHGDAEKILTNWIRHLRVDPGNRYLAALLHVSRKQLTDLRIGTIICAALFATEGTGLWFERRWAEWFTVIASGLLLPLEVYELWRRPHVSRAVILAANVAIVVYLAITVARSMRRETERRKMKTQEG